MLGRSYTVLILDRSSGVVRSVTIRLRSFLTGVSLILMAPVLIGLGAIWSAREELGSLKSANARLVEENASDRAATGEFTEQIQALEGVINALGSEVGRNPLASEAAAKLPAVLKARATGGGDTGQRIVNAADLATELLATPLDTFGVLHGLLESLANRLQFVRVNVEHREALFAAAPSIWPAQGWLTASFGPRRDPFTGEPEFHQGIDISTDEGQPVVATANGTVETASYSGDYGNLIVLQHGFGLMTRYGHLSAFATSPGTRVKRGDVIGYVGATGRATGPHLHYEVLADGKLLNPLQFLTAPGKPAS